MTADSALVWLEAPPPVMTPLEAREYARTVIGRADEADGGHTMAGFVTRQEALDRMEAALEWVNRLKEEHGLL